MTKEKTKALFCKPVNVITFAGTFPSLIQPWLVAQLVQIARFGGENLILSRRSEKGVYGEDIDNYKLNNCYELVPDDRKLILKTFLGNLMSRKGITRLLKGLLRYPKILFSKDFSFKEKLFSIALTPYFSLRNFDIIHSHSEMVGNKLLAIVVALDKPLVITFHGLPPVGVKPISSQERLRYTQLASVILVNTEFAKKQYSSLGVSPEKIQILPQGTNMQEFPYRPNQYAAAKLNILTVGRFHPDKGQMYAISAIASLIGMGVNICYRLVGNGPDRKKLEEQCKAEGIEGYVEFYSGVSDSELRSIYAQSDIFILPSLKSKDGFHEETQGVVLQEAQASGLIVIATKTGGIPECIDDGVSGFLIADRSSEAIEDMVLKIIELQDSWADIQSKARAWVEQRYDIEKIGERINEVYNQILD